MKSPFDLQGKFDAIIQSRRLLLLLWYCIIGWNFNDHQPVVLGQQNQEETGLVVDTCHAVEKTNDAFATTRALFLKNIERLVKDFYAVIQPVFPTKYSEETWSSRKVREVRSNRRREVRTTSALQPKERPDIESVWREQENDNQNYGRYESSSLSPLDPHEGMILEVYQQHRDGHSSLDVSYELLQPMDLEMGEVFDHHASDYAYQPILFHGTGIPPSSATDGNSVHDGMLEETSFRGWWQWWLPLWNRQRTNSDRFWQYRTDDTAFAGGSHGKVWRARRKCRKATNSKYCQQPLILKRMDLKAGYRILEAGLRECYFGSLLAGKDRSTSDLFTHYVDHFFREEDDRLELWIVYDDAGVSLRGFLYSAVLVGDFLVYQNSWFWKQLRLGVSNAPTSDDADSDKAADCYTGDGAEYKYPTTEQSHAQAELGKKFIKTILHQILESAAVLHHEGIVHRDIKPSNILCRSNIDIERPRRLEPNDEIFCKLGDFSSAYNEVVAHHYYTGGPSRKEQTDEYAPPEAIFGYAFYENAREHLSPSFDSWSIGVVALELLLGTPSVFSVDQRTRAVLTHKLQKAGATSGEVKKAMYLAALSQYCIFNPSQGDWPLRSGDPLHNISMTKQSCTLYDFRHALRLRDPLALGFESSDLLLHLIWQLLAFDPEQRITAIDALHHPYFADIPIREELARPENKAVESQMLDPRMDFTVHDTVAEFVCPHCQRVFHDWRSCQQHAVGRKHAYFCTYDKNSLPTCIGAHPMLPAHAYSGHCDIQGRRRTMEDFHSIHLLPTSSLYAILDGHNGNFASKFVAKYLRDELSGQIPTLPSPNDDTAVGDWKRSVQDLVRTSFGDVHEKLLDAASLTPYTSMQQSGTTVTLALITNTSIVVGSIGDTRAVLSSRQTDDTGDIVLRPRQLTKDHVASDATEKDLVKLRGGRIEYVNGLHRVNGTLAITRSIGDAKLAPVLSREPDVVALTRNEWEDMCGVVNETIPCFLIIASDGLWDTMTNQEAVDMVSEVVLRSVQGVNSDWRETAAMQRAAEALTLEAFVRGSNDNIGVYVVALPLIETDGESSSSPSPAT